jgi:FdrA protein
MSWSVTVIPGRYADSVRLMSIARAIRQRDGVTGCEVVMGTVANVESLAALGVLMDAGPADIVIAVNTDDPRIATAALAAGEMALVSAPSPGSGAAAAVPLPHSLATALQADPSANVALVSVPGEYAALEAHHAIGRSLHVFLFSDHVSVADEVALKRRAAARRLLMMGPGCGTAMLGGVGLGFMNVVRRGPVGIVAAAGTGAQEAACLLEQAGTGVSQIIGVGGRDLSAGVGGIMFREAMRMLGEDPETETLLLVSKAPAVEVVQQLSDAVPSGVRVLAAFVGWDGAPAPVEVHSTLEAGAYAAAYAAAPADPPVPDTPAWRRAAGRHLLGLFSGGSLAHEALTILEPLVGPIGGNTSHRMVESGHSILDLGEEEYTRGRPHPMVDLQVRLEMLDAVRERPEVGCVLIDVVLGHGSHPDPASELEPVIRSIAGKVPVIVRVCGTPADPQHAPHQEAVLREAGALIGHSNAAAARLAARAVCGG